MLELRIAWRFLWRSRAQSILILLGIAVGIAVQVFVGSLITSLQDSLIERTVGSAAHVTLEPPEGQAALRFSRAERERLELDSRITAVAPVQVVSALLPVGSDGAPVVVKGGDFVDLDAIYKLSAKMVAGEVTLADDRMVVGKELAEEYAVAPGATVRLVLADGSSVPATVEGVFDLGNQIVNQSTAFAGLVAISSAVGRSPEDVSAVEVQIADVFASAEVATQLAAQYPDLAVSEWQAKNTELLTALRSQSTSSYMIQVFVIVAVMLGIASTLAVSAVRKTRQIGILKALGMADRRTGLVFLWQAGILGTLGTVLGIGVSLALVSAFSTLARRSDTGLFPITPRVSFVLLSAAIGIAVALLSAIIPYRKTARLDPIEVIQGA
jgi:lipoprotein-releasing system permease protein